MNTRGTIDPRPFSPHPQTRQQIQQLKLHAHTLRRFFVSPDFKMHMIDYLLHPSAWHETHQLVVELLPNGQWVIPSPHVRSHNGSCILPLITLSYHRKRMEAIAEKRTFETIQQCPAEELRAVAEKLYAQQVVKLQRRICSYLEWMIARGYLD